MGELNGIRFGGVIATAAKAHHLDPDLLAAVAAQETGGPSANSGRNIVGDAGHGHGLFQIDDRYHAFASTPAAMNPAKNADFAASMLETNLKATGGNIKAALSMYNAGSPTKTGTKTTWGDGTTLGYADSVLRHLRDLAAPVTSALASELRAGRSDDASLVGGLAAAARSLTAPASRILAAIGGGVTELPELLSGTAGATTGVAADDAFNVRSLVSNLAQSAAGTPSAAGSATGTSAATSATYPGALQLPSPVTQTGYSYHSYGSEVAAGSGAATDADKNIGSIVDSDSDVFSKSGDN